LYYIYYSHVPGYASASVELRGKCQLVDMYHEQGIFMAAMVAMTGATSEPTVAVVVLGFAFRHSLALDNRLATASARYHQLCLNSPPPFFITTGGDTDSSGTTEGHDLFVQATEAHDIPQDRVLVEDQARYTIENALLVYQLLAKHAPTVTTIELVTNSFHMPRSLLIFSNTAPSHLLVKALPASNGSDEAMTRETGRTIASWERLEGKQMALLRAENNSDVGNILSERILAHNRLEVAARQNNLGALRSFLDLHEGASADSGCALHYATLNGCVEAVQFLLENGADGNRRNENGATPMHFVKFVVDEGKRVKIKALLWLSWCEQVAGGEQVLGKSALWGGVALTASAVESSDLKALSLGKMRAIGNVLAFGNVVYSKLIECAREGDVEGVRRWIGSEGSACHVDGPENYSRTTALAHAASGGSAACVELLLDAGADVSLPRSPRANGFHYCAYKLHRGCSEVMLRRGGKERVEQALGSRGESALWASLGGLKPSELCAFVSTQAKLLGEELAIESI